MLDIVLMALHQKSHEIACLTAPPTVSHKGGICRWVRIRTKNGRRETKCFGDGHAHETISPRRAAHKFVIQVKIIISICDAGSVVCRRRKEGGLPSGRRRSSLH